jgi:26S proteasome regulatory subunit N13
MQFSEFQSILGNIAQSSSRSDLDLAEVLSLDVMAPILANKQIQEKLVQHLPDSDILPKTEFELRQTLTTPQFKKAMSSFSAALQSGQLGPLLAQFNLPEQVCTAAAQGNLEAFAKAMEEHAAATKSSAEKKDNDEMDTK